VDDLQNGDYTAAVTSAVMLVAKPLKGVAMVSKAVKAEGKVAKELSTAKSVTSRPSGFRKKTVQGAWNDAAQGSKKGSKACPTCAKDAEVLPGRGTRDWDVDHQPKWKDRDLAGKTREEVLDEYNRDVRLRCPTCNRGDN
jgi:hypothetical protein